MSTTHTYILGAPDPEMAATEAVLRAAGKNVLYATASGQRVRPGNAYEADGIASPDGLAADPVEVGEAGTAVLVECGGPIEEQIGYWRDPQSGAVAVMGQTGYEEWTPAWSRCDHHRPGDPGYGRPPSQFLAASSLGQVIARLAAEGKDQESCPLYTLGWAFYAGGTPRLGRGDFYCHVEDLGWQTPSPSRTPEWSVGAWPGARVHVPQDIVLVAAADHCLGAAYRGECPGVDPDALMRWRAESRARFQDRTVEDLLLDIQATTEALKRAPTFEFASHVTVADMRREPPYPELPEAATRAGVGYISGPLETPGGRRKMTCSGASEQVKAFMEHWAPEQGLQDIYGDPSRGFAGGYLPDDD